MAITAFSGPVGQFGVTLTTSAGTGLLGNDLEHNSQRAPMFSDLGDMMMDPRVAYAYQPGSAVTKLTLGFYNNLGVVDYVPFTLNSSAFYTSTGLSSAVVGAFSLISSGSTLGAIPTTIIAPETGKATGTLIAIDSTAAYVTFGSDGTVATWNPAAGTGRNITIKLSTSGDAGAFTIAGRDMYGYKMTETITVGANTSFAGLKAFKYVSSITNCTTPVSSGISIGFGDVYGFPLYTPYVGLNAQVLLTATASQAAGDATGTMSPALASTATAVSTSPDVRGTYASSTASNGTIRLQMVIMPTVANIAAITSTNVAPLFGATQFSSV